MSGTSLRPAITAVPTSGEMMKPPSGMARMTCDHNFQPAQAHCVEVQDVGYRKACNAPAFSRPSVLGGMARTSRIASARFAAPDSPGMVCQMDAPSVTLPLNAMRLFSVLSPATDECYGPRVAGGAPARARRNV